jgi:SAM-dependent methyltransferase
MKPAVAHFYWSQLDGAERVLDLGCAGGDLGRYKPEPAEVYGLEVNPALAKAASQHETSFVWNLDAMLPLPFPDNYFDAVVAKDILEHLQQPWRTLAEVRRVVRPAGVVIASVICYRNHRVWSDYTHVRGFTMQSVRQLFVDAGFNVEKIWPMGGIPLTSRMQAIWLIPYVLRIPPFDWLWTSSYELKASKPA